MLCFRTLGCFENDLVLQIKEKFERERCCMFFPFSYFCDGCVGLTLTGSRCQHICAFLVRVTCVFFLLLFQWIVFESISWVVAVSLTGRWEGKKRKVSPKWRVAKQYHVSRMIFLKNPCSCGQILETLCNSPGLV